MIADLWSKNVKLSASFKTAPSSYVIMSESSKFRKEIFLHYIGIWLDFLVGDDVVYLQQVSMLPYLFSHLNGAVLETLSRPSLLITDAFSALNIQARRKERDIQLMSQYWIKFDLPPLQLNLALLLLL